MATTPIPEESKVREGEYTPYTDALFLDTDLVEIDENVYSVDINGQLTTAPATDKDVERFVQNRHQTVIASSDATAVWLRPAS